MIRERQPASVWMQLIVQEKDYAAELAACMASSTQMDKSYAGEYVSSIPSVCVVLGTRTLFAEIWWYPLGQPDAAKVL